MWLANVKSIQPNIYDDNFPRNAKIPKKYFLSYFGRQIVWPATWIAWCCMKRKKSKKKQIYCWIYFTCPQVYSQFCIIQMIFLTYKIWVLYALNYLLQAENRFNSILKLHRHFRAQICTTNEYIYNITTNVNDIF